MIRYFKRIIFILNSGTRLELMWADIKNILDDIYANLFTSCSHLIYFIFSFAWALALIVFLPFRPIWKVIRAFISAYTFRKELDDQMDHNPWSKPRWTTESQRKFIRAVSGIFLFSGTAVGFNYLAWGLMLLWQSNPQMHNQYANNTVLCVIITALFILAVVSICLIIMLFTFLIGSFIHKFDFRTNDPGF